MGNEIPKETPIVLVPEALPVKKPFRLNKWHVIMIALVAVIAVQGVLYLSLNSRYDTLNASHKSLTVEHQNLMNDYNTLGDTYSSYVSSYADLRDQINKRTQHTALSPTISTFVTSREATVRDKVIQITGGWSNPSDSNEYWSDIKRMYDWVVNNIEYRSDGLFPVMPTTPSGYLEYAKDMWQLPKETLNVTQGDCEDMAILLTSMIRCYNEGKYSTECILIESSTSGHAGVQIPVAGGLMTILDPAGKYYTQDSYGNIANKDISTEINNWLTYWKPRMGSDVHVDRVFSDDLDKSFSSTSQYTSWMYSR